MILFIFHIQRRSYILGGSRRPGERVTIGGQHPLDYDYYDSGDDHNLIFYGQQNNIGNIFGYFLTSLLL